MSTYSIAQAKDQLSRLIDEALAGEIVTITRHGKPVVSLTPNALSPKPLTVEYLRALRRRAQARPSLGAELCVAGERNARRGSVSYCLDTNVLISLFFCGCAFGPSLRVA